MHVCVCALRPAPVYGRALATRAARLFALVFHPEFRSEPPPALCPDIRCRYRYACFACPSRPSSSRQQFTCPPPTGGRPPPNPFGGPCPRSATGIFRVHVPDLIAPGRRTFGFSRHLPNSPRDGRQTHPFRAGHVQSRRCENSHIVNRRGIRYWPNAYKKCPYFFLCSLRKTTYNTLALWASSRYMYYIIYLCTQLTKKPNCCRTGHESRKNDKLCFLKYPPINQINKW